MSMTSEMKVLVDEIEGAGRSVTAEVIVAKAKDEERFPGLNGHFWAPSEADLAQEARIARAHRLLITLKVTVRETGEVTRMMVHTPGERGYQSMPAIVRQPDLARLKLQQLVEDISRARSRLRAFRAALPSDLADDIDAALATAERHATPIVSTPASVTYGMAGIGMQE